MCRAVLFGGGEDWLSLFSQVRVVLGGSDQARRGKEPNMVILMS